MKRALLTLGALVLLLFALSSNAGALVKNDPAWTVPDDCLHPDEVKKVLDYIMGDSTNPDDEHYKCTSSTDGKTYTIDSGYIRYSISLLSADGYGDGVLQYAEGKSQINRDNVCTNSQLGYLGLVPDTGRSAGSGYVQDIQYLEPTWGNGGYINQGGESAPTQSQIEDKWNGILKGISKVNDAYAMSGSCWLYTPLNIKIRQSFSQGYKILRSDGTTTCTVLDCSDTPGAPPGSGADGGTGTTTPACTRSDGSTSGNPYDCAPTDNETSCSIVNIPCNFKKAFIPRDDFLQTEVPRIFSKQWNLPTQVVDEIKVDVPLFENQTIRVGLDFKHLRMNETFQGILKLMAGFASLFWLLNFFGIPNLLGNSRGTSDLPDSISKARRMADRVNKKNGRAK